APAPTGRRTLAMITPAAADEIGAAVPAANGLGVDLLTAERTHAAVSRALGADPPATVLAAHGVRPDLLTTQRTRPDALVDLIHGHLLFERCTAPSQIAALRERTVS